jgi:hypothetical protein
MRERRVYITQNRREDKCTATSLENAGKTLYLHKHWYIITFSFSPSYLYFPLGLCTLVPNFKTPQNTNEIKWKVQKVKQKILNKKSTNLCRQVQRELLQPTNAVNSFSHHPHIDLRLKKNVFVLSLFSQFIS